MPSGLMPSLVVGYQYPDLIRNTPNLIGYWRMRESSGTVMHDELNLVNGTYGGSPGLGFGTPIPGGGAPKFNGTSHYATIAKDLSAYAQLSLSFWLYWDAYDTDDDLAMEFTANANSNNGFYFDLDYSGGSVLAIQMGASGPLAWRDTFPRSSVAAWHHYLFGLNRATPVNAAYVDGVPQTLTLAQHGAGTYGNFANSTLNVMCRNAASLFGAGKMSELAMWGGRLLTVNDAASQYNVGVGR